MGDDNVCKFFLEGKCKRGHKCRFLHGTSSTAASPKPMPRQKRPSQASTEPPASQKRSATSTPAAKTPISTPASSAKRSVGGDRGGASGKPTKSKSTSKAKPSASVGGRKDGDKGICSYFLAGTCTRGSKCRFRHTETEGQAATPKASAKKGKGEKSKAEPKKQKEPKSKRMETDNDDNRSDDVSGDSSSGSSGGSESDTESSISESDSGSAMSESSGSSEEDVRRKKRALKKAAATKLKKKKQLAKEAAKRKKLRQRQREKERAKALTSSSSKRRRRASRRRSLTPSSSSLDSYTSSSYYTTTTTGSSSDGSESDTESEAESSSDLDRSAKHKWAKKKRDRLAKRKYRERRRDRRRRRRRYSTSSSDFTSETSSDVGTEDASESEASVDAPPPKKAKKVAAAPASKDGKLKEKAKEGTKARKEKAKEDTKARKEKLEEKAKEPKPKDAAAPSKVSADRLNAAASDATPKTTPAKAKEQAIPISTPLQAQLKQKEKQKQQAKEKEKERQQRQQKKAEEKDKKQPRRGRKPVTNPTQPPAPATPMSRGVTPGASPLTANVSSTALSPAQTPIAPRDYVQYLVELTRAHPRYEQTYTRMWSRPIPGGWIAPTQPRAPHGSSARAPRVLGLDCEMVETDTDTNAVARVTVIAHGITEQGEYPATPLVLLDEHIKPPGNVINYRTDVSGVKEEHLATAASLEEVHERLLRVVRRDTVLVGHSLNFDLEALRLRHESVIDTSLLFRVDTMGRRTFALRDVVMEVLGQDCQPHGEAHDSLQDALWPLELTRHVIDSLHTSDQGGRAQPLFDRRSNSPIVHPIFVINLPELFLTRLEVTGIPEGFTQERLTEILNGHGCNVTPELYTKFNPGSNGRGGQAKLQYPSEEAVIEAFSKLPVEFMHQTSDHSYLKQLALPSRDLLKISVYVSKPNSVLDFQLKQAKEQRDAVAPPPRAASPAMRAQSLFGPPRGQFPYRNAAMAGGPRPPMPHMQMRRPHVPARMSAAMAASQRRHFPPTPMHGNAMMGRRPIAAGGVRRPRAPHGIAPPKPKPRDHLSSPAFF